MLPLIAAGAGISLLAGIIGYLVENGYEEEARKIEQDARKEHGNVSDEAVQAAAAKVLGPTALAKITADPRFRQAQEESLSALADISKNGGFSLEDQANLNRFQNEAARRASGQRAAVLERLASRGIAGGGAEIAQNIAAQQDTANREAQMGLDLAAQGRKRALDAILARGDLASRLESADYNRQAQAATAQDAIDRFNNVSQYDRANDTYGRQVDNANRQLGFAQRDADQRRNDGQRRAQAIAGTIKGVGDIATGFGANEQYNQRFDKMLSALGDTQPTPIRTAAGDNTPPDPYDAAQQSYMSAWDQKDED